MHIMYVYALFIQHVGVEYTQMLRPSERGRFAGGQFFGRYACEDTSLYWHVFGLAKRNLCSDFCILDFVVSRIFGA